MKSWTVGEITRVPGATYGLFRLAFEVVFSEIINCSDTNKSHKIYFKVLSFLFFQQQWLSVHKTPERLGENQRKQQLYFSAIGDWSDEHKQLVHLCCYSFAAVVYLTKNFVLWFCVWLESLPLGMYSAEQCSWFFSNESSYFLHCKLSWWHMYLFWAHHALLLDSDQAHVLLHKDQQTHPFWTVSSNLCSVLF